VVVCDIWLWKTIPDQIDCGIQLLVGCDITWFQKATQEA
jgi:hypothetical protein